ncbi:hypothetical protein [Trinickia mobilis]|uniref:hypothetical protein n=1 Tax=Trinickia mobilis TaxID=2816356 RepID=UPI001F5C4838|nr:hypothetical protein [Trinickia mobilis]
MQPAPVPATGKKSERSRKKLDNANEVLAQMGKLVTANAKVVSALGARAMVLGKFFDAALPHLATSQRAEIAKSFRHGIEDAMSLMDDVPLPAEYHSTLLQFTNSILAALSHGSSGSRSD